VRGKSVRKVSWGVASGVAWCCDPATCRERRGHPTTTNGRCRQRQTSNATGSRALRRNFRSGCRFRQPRVPGMPKNPTRSPIKTIPGPTWAPPERIRPRFRPPSWWHSPIDVVWGQPQGAHRRRSRSPRLRRLCRLKTHREGGPIRPGLGRPRLRVDQGTAGPFRGPGRVVVPARRLRWRHAWGTRLVSSS
jgi:hypothetical protein